MDKIYSEIYGEIISTTPKAICLATGFDETWIPRSCIENGYELSEFKDTGMVELSIETWFCEKEGLE